MPNEKKFNPNYAEPSTQYTREYPFSSIVFPENVPVMGADLNEMQAITNKSLADIFVKTICSNKSEDFGDSGNGYWAPISYISKDESTEVRGYYINKERTEIYNVNITASAAMLKGNIYLKITSAIYAGADDTGDGLTNLIKANKFSSSLISGELANYMQDNDFDESVNRRKGCVFELVSQKPIEADGAIYIQLYDTKEWIYPSYISMFDNSKTQQGFKDLAEYLGTSRFVTSSEAKKLRDVMNGMVVWANVDGSVPLTVQGYYPADAMIKLNEDFAVYNASGASKFSILPLSESSLDFAVPVNVSLDSLGSSAVVYLYWNALYPDKILSVLELNNDYKEVYANRKVSDIKVYPSDLGSIVLKKCQPFTRDLGSGAIDVSFNIDDVPNINTLEDSVYKTSEPNNLSLLPDNFVAMLMPQFPAVFMQGSKAYTIDKQGNIVGISGNVNKYETVEGIYLSNWKQAEHSNNSSDTIKIGTVTVPCDTWYCKVAVSLPTDSIGDISLMTDVALDDLNFTDSAAADAMVDAYQSIMKIEIGIDENGPFALLIAYDNKPDINFKIRFLWLYNM